MEELNGRKRRFDETFRTLLVIVTITTTFSFNLYKDALSNTFFFDTFVFFIASIIIWAVANLVGGSNEYLLKLVAWHFLIFDITVSFIRLILGQLFIPKLWSLVILVAILFPTFWIKEWLQEVEVIPVETTLSRSILPVLCIWTVYQILWISMT